MTRKRINQKKPVYLVGQQGKALKNEQKKMRSVRPRDFSKRKAPVFSLRERID